MKGLRFNLILIFGWISFGICVLFSSLKSQLILSENIKELVNQIFPQGWGFFTKNPRDLLLRIYKIENSKLTEIDISNQSFKNRFGCSRTSRMIGYEISKLAESVKMTDWKQNLTGNIVDNINDKSIEVKSKYLFRHFTKGEYLLKLYKPIPYAWARFNQEKYNHFSVAKVNLK